MQLSFFQQIFSLCLEILMYPFWVFGYKASLFGFMVFTLIAFLVLFFFFRTMK